MNGSVESRSRTTIFCIALALLLVLVCQLAYTSRTNSISWDEGHHLFDGYNILKQHDYGLNPEVPPLVKMVAAAPLLRMHLVVPPLQGRSEQTEAFLDGKDFVFHNDADKLLFRARMAVSVFMIGLAICVFFAAYEMFGPVAGLLALAFLVFDPNFLAHGALVTTDAAISCCIFLALYLAYRYAKQPTPARLLLVGLATGLAMAAKFTGILILPMLVLLVLGEAFSARDWRLFVRRIVALVVVGAVSFGILWSFYGFRYSARPAGRTLNPPLADYLKGLPSQQDTHHLALLARMHILPEAYIFGLANTKITEFADTSYFFGHIYRHGTWLYFPAAFVIKSTLPFLLLLVVAVALIATGRLKRRRELYFLLIPPALFFAVAMHSTMDIGHRHILPIYPFLYVLIAAAAASLIRRNRRWSYAIAALLLWQIATSTRVAPAYMAYANEAWGGPSSLHKYLGDANTDWGQQLKAAKKYLDSRGIKNCWFAYFADGVVDTSYYGIPCKRLPTVENTLWLNLPMDVPPEIDGPVLISDGVLAGIDYGQGALNPYQQFRSLRPTAAIDYGLFVYDGHFKVPLAYALAETQHTQNLVEAGHIDQALPAVQQAATFAPDSVTVQVSLGDVLMKLHHTQEAETHYQQALHSAQTIEPELQADSVPMIEAKLATARSH
ncbi:MULTISPECIES: glycosyltransferase family 39 protein [Acidobacteriaceae]|uniref:ArnT family glycosyltransferase n=1 Tax=Acidobacteriaceae TaxID=204434 RepID=UPI00131E3E5D|nr:MULTISPECIES: glycosyltransferase family 39 protein [Acidobacteriaceae]MDW5266605.1 glycosyltransferase family 39 protein [Edaphobacter sp.]